MLFYRLWSALIICVNVLYVPLVVSDSLNLNDENIYDNPFKNPQRDNAFRLSLNDASLQTGFDGEFLLNDAVIEYMSVLLPSKTVPLTITDVSKDIYYIIIELHTFFHEVSLSYFEKKVPHSYVTGTNIGLVAGTNRSGENVTLFVENPNRYNVTVLVAVTFYQKSAPIPGGCNMEFDTEVAPYLRLNDTGSLTMLLSQPASASTSAATRGAGCQILPGSLMRYDVYRLYLPETDLTERTYFDSVKSMLTVDRIKRYGTKVPPSLTGLVNKRLFASYVGTGSVFAVIVYSSLGDDGPAITSSAYVPIVTYGCSPTLGVDGCRDLDWDYVELISILILGLFLAHLGHHCFQTGMFLHGAFVCGTVVHIVLANSHFTTALVPTPVVIGSLVGGLIWLKVWCYCGIPILSVLLPLLNMSSLMTATFIHFSSGWSVLQPVIQSDANYWLALACGSLSLTVLLIMHTKAANILTNAVVGAYTTLIAVDYYVGSNVKYVVVNVYRRATIEGFGDAVLDPPFQSKDMYFMFLWFTITLSGYCLQHSLVQNKPPFPPPAHDRSGYISYHSDTGGRGVSSTVRFLKKLTSFFVGVPHAEQGFFDNTTAEETVPILSQYNYSSPVTSTSDVTISPPPNT